ncbi:MAG: Wzz/FepE/Etk N-terminal domain-containing protein [Vicingaceae bacterium]
MIDLKNMNSNLFNVITKNIKLLGIVGIAAAILSVIFSSSMFIAPKFKSTAIVYPSNLGEYSEESPIEQMLQWFDSKKVKDAVIKDNDLYSHYEIDEEDKLSSFYILEEYNENISVTETKYESAEITVLDTDPEKAYIIAQSIIDNFSKEIRKVHKQRAEEEFTAIDKEFNRVKEQLYSVSENLKKLRVEYHIINYGSQSDHVSKGFLKTFEGANSSSVNTQEILKLKKNIEEKGGEFIMSEKRFYHLISSYNYWENEYLKSKRSIERKMTYTNIVNSPQIPVKKVYPVRWIIVLLSTFGALAFTFVLLLFKSQLNSEA